MTKLSKYLSMVKFAHTIFAMPFAIVGFGMAVDLPEVVMSWRLLLLVVLCMIFARNAAMAFNRYIDRDIDALNPRTRMREIPSGQIHPLRALAFVLVNSAMFIATTAYINNLVLWLSPVALATILGYSYTKRFTRWCHLVLGLGLSLAPIGAYLAVVGHFAWPPIFVSLAVLVWVAGFDIIYALQDDDFDARVQLHSLPSRIGRQGALIFSRVLHGSSVVFLLCAGTISGYGYFYFIGVVIFGVLLLRQHMVVNPTDLSKVNLAFFTLNGVASVVFCALFLAEIIFLSE